MCDRDHNFLPSRLLNIEEAAAYLGVAKRTLQDKVRLGLVPHTRIFRHVRFTPEHLAQIIEDGASAPVRPRSTARSRL